MAAPLTRRFLQRTSGKVFGGGSKCVTCQHPKRRRLESEALEFNEARRAGRTSAPWSVYVNRVLRPRLGCTTHAPLLRHLKVCLGWTIH